MKVTAVLTVRSEGSFLLEWLAHHRAVGITGFLVFSKDCHDGTDRRWSFTASDCFPPPAARLSIWSS